MKKQKEIWIKISRCQLMKKGRIKMVMSLVRVKIQIRC